MTQKIKLDDNEYDIKDLSDKAKSTVGLMQFATIRIEELNNISALLQRAKKSYIDSLRKEIISNKTGFEFGED